MSNIIDVETFLTASDLPVIDVRSPGEFESGHIPNAINIPIFDDDERAEIGTLYKQTGKEQAMIRGLQIVGKKAAELISSLESAQIGSDCFVHCWRGGLRSEGFAWFMRGCGYQPQRITGGYKAFRTVAHDAFAQPKRVIILAGASGSGKTQLLSTLKENGQQVIDLEKLACHRGSAFGGISQPMQPTVEQFENNLFLQWKELDPERPVWVECESRSVGSVFIPQPIWTQMMSAPAISIEVDREKRIEFLVEEYGDLPPDELADAIRKIGKRLGGDRLQAALTALENSDVHSCAAIALEYYDRAYIRSLGQDPYDPVETIQLNSAGDSDSIPTMIEMAARMTQNLPLVSSDATNSH